jgi:hypothetical protein
VPIKVCVDFWSVVLILLLMVFFFCGLSRTIRVVFAFVVDGVILVVCA